MNVLPRYLLMLPLSESCGFAPKNPSVHQCCQRPCHLLYKFPLTFNLPKCNNLCLAGLNSICHFSSQLHKEQFPYRVTLSQCLIFQNLSNNFKSARSHIMCKDSFQVSKTQHRNRIWIPCSFPYNISAISKPQILRSHSQIFMWFSRVTLTNVYVVWKVQLIVLWHKATVYTKWHTVAKS